MPTHLVTLGVIADSTNLDHRGRSCRAGPQSRLTAAPKANLRYLIPHPTSLRISPDLPERIAIGSSKSFSVISFPPGPTSIKPLKMSYPLEDVRPMFELRGRNYVVTGGAQGIGFAVTRAICEMGGNVAVMDIQDKPVDAKEWSNLSQKFGAKTVYIQTDVTKQESLNEAFAKAIQELGSIDGLVPAAGIAIDKPFIEQSWEEFTRIQEINVGPLSLHMKISML